MITLLQAKLLKNGTILYSARNFNKKGEPQRWKVTSVKTWKTRPRDVEIGLKNGLKNYDRINQDDLALVCLTEEEAKNLRGA